jgi:penicillin-binding protein-related factor A (putative recombinase)
MLEKDFQQQVLKRLRSHEGLHVFVKEAKSLRGIPDLIGCYKGLYFCWELKKSEAEARKNTGRIVLQRHHLKQVQNAGGIAEIVYPENLNEKMSELLVAGRKRGSS